MARSPHRLPDRSHVGPLKSHPPPQPAHPPVPWASARAPGKPYRGLQPATTQTVPWASARDPQTRTVGFSPRPPKPYRGLQPATTPKHVARAFLLGPIPLKNTGDFKGDANFVPGLKPRLRFLSAASNQLQCTDQRSSFQGVAGQECPVYCCGLSPAFTASGFSPPETQPADSHRSTGP